MLVYSYSGVAVEEELMTCMRCGHNYATLHYGHTAYRSDRTMRTARSSMVCQWQQMAYKDTFVTENFPSYLF